MLNPHCARHVRPPTKPESDTCFSYLIYHKIIITFLSIAPLKTCAEGEKKSKCYYTNSQSLLPKPHKGSHLLAKILSVWKARIQRDSPSLHFSLHFQGHFRKLKAETQGKLHPDGATSNTNHLRLHKLNKLPHADHTSGRF